MTTGLTVTCPIHFSTGRKGRKHLVEGVAPVQVPTPGRVPRLSRLMALSVRLEGLLAEGHVRDMAELARLGHVSRARITQIMNLRSLAPDIQEELLFLPPTVAGHDAIKEWRVRPIAAELNWKKQRRMWVQLKGSQTGAARIP